MATGGLAERIHAIFERHMDAELAGDLDGTLGTMSANPHLVNVPTMVGGSGAEGVRRFYAKRLGQGEHLTKQCRHWLTRRERQVGWCPEAA